MRERRREGRKERGIQRSNRWKLKSSTNDEDDALKDDAKKKRI